MMLQKALWLSLLFIGFFKFSCQTKGLGESCTPPADDSDDECTVVNSECKVNKCLCKTGYRNESTACLKSLEAECTDANECVSNSKCEAITGKKICSCKDGFGAKGGLCAKLLSEVSCSDKTACKENAVCDATTNKCKCSPNFAMNVDVCEPKNSATTTGAGVILLVILLSKISFLFL